MYIAKADSLEAIEDRLSKGADAIEIQLLPRNRDINFIDLSNKIYSVHTELGDNKVSAVTIEDSRNKNMEKMNTAFKLANEIGKKENRRIGVVVHNGIGLDGMIQLGIFEYTFTRIERILRTYESTELLIENSTIASSKGISAINLTSTQLVNVIKALKNKSTCGDRIFGVLDIVHAMSNSRILSELYQVDSNEVYENYFRDYADVIKEIHFANIINKGLKYEEHGVEFRINNNEDERFFKDSMKFIDKYLKNTDICIEVREKDYKNAINFENILNKIVKSKVD